MHPKEGVDPELLEVARIVEEAGRGIDPQSAAYDRAIRSALDRRGKKTKEVPLQEVPGGNFFKDVQLGKPEEEKATLENLEGVQAVFVPNSFGNEVPKNASGKSSGSDDGPRRDPPRDLEESQ